MGLFQENRPGPEIDLVLDLDLDLDLDLVSGISGIHVLEFLLGLGQRLGLKESNSNPVE